MKISSIIMWIRGIKLQVFLVQTELVRTSEKIHHSQLLILIAFKIKQNQNLNKTKQNKQVRKD